MNNKKVKELIEDAIYYMNEGAIYTSETRLNKALEELSKSDWVSVEDKQPPKNVVVQVCNKQEPDGLILAYRTNQETMKIVYPGNIAMCNITHWKPIEKLEE